MPSPSRTVHFVHAACRTSSSIRARPHQPAAHPGTRSRERERISHTPHKSPAIHSGASRSGRRPTYSPSEGHPMQCPDVIAIHPEATEHAPHAPPPRSPARSPCVVHRAQRREQHGRRQLPTVQSKRVSTVETPAASSARRSGASLSRNNAWRTPCPSFACMCMCMCKPCERGKTQRRGATLPIGRRGALKPSGRRARAGCCIKSRPTMHGELFGLRLASWHRPLKVISKAGSAEVEGKAKPREVAA